MNCFSDMKLLVPTDFSVNSLDAVLAAKEMAGSGHNVYALNVVEPISDAMIAGELPPDFQVQESEELRRQLRKRRLHGFLEKHGCSEARVEVRTGDPALWIARFTKEYFIDMIVMMANGSPNRGSHSISPVTERVLCSTDRPVLVLQHEERPTDWMPPVHMQASRRFLPAEVASASHPR